MYKDGDGMEIEMHSYLFFDLRVMSGVTYIVIEVCPHRGKVSMLRCVFSVDVSRNNVGL